MKHSSEFKAGLLAACEHLKQTAEDFEQRIPARKEENSANRARHKLGAAREMEEIKIGESKAQLLRGQIHCIMENIL